MSLAASSGIQGRLSWYSVLDKVRHGIHTCFRSVLSRFQLAASVAREIVEGERFAASQAKAIVFDPNSGQTLSVYGYLFSRDEATPLFEGLNFFSESGSLNRLEIGEQEARVKDGVISIRVIGGAIELEHPSAMGKTTTAYTNEFLAIGKQNYLVKILPEEYRYGSSTQREEQGQ